MQNEPNSTSDPSDRETRYNTGREARYNKFVVLLARHDIAIRRFVRSLLTLREVVGDLVEDMALECRNKFSDFALASSDEAVDEFVRWELSPSELLTRMNWKRRI